MSPEQQGPCWPPLGCPAAPNGKKARHFPPQGHTRGFVRELRDARLGWWGGEAGESHSTHETCVFRLVDFKNSNSNCRPSAAARQLTFASQGQESGATPGSRVVRRTRDLVSKVDQHAGAAVSAPSWAASAAQNGLS